MSAFLSVQGLQAGYGRAQVLFDVSFDVRAGEMITLLGRNGMGRSTTVKCLFGMLGANAGRVFVGGVPMLGEPSHRIARRGLALVPEGRQIFTGLTVEENLVATARDGRHGDTRPWTLERVYGFFPRLKERRGNLGWQLSGGEQQMLAIGRALMSNPALLLMDEPTEGLAPLLVREVGRVIAELKRAGLSILLVEQNLPMAASVADRVHVLNRGQIVYSGRPAELLANEDVKSRYLGVASTT
ncbi:MAG TPA: ABC transporter ATP-binding protein [Methylomirabilota bacterium]|nr:ABC transporter ATP-binding protein [Methylomirabilota bacterium]